MASIAATARHPEAAGGPSAPVAYELIELFFFAYRDFVSDPDRLLSEFGFGRAHHRVLHFVDRNPGLTIAALLDILKITKQSLNRVLKELVQKRFIEVRPGVQDRRQRHLHTTPAGRDLARKLAAAQTERVSRALQALSSEQADGVRGWLTAMIEDSERPRAISLIRSGGPGSGLS